MSLRLLRIGKDLRARLMVFFDAPLGADAAPLELLQTALDDLERRIQPAGRGRRIFPYNRVVVTIGQRDADPGAIEAVFADLESRLRERLTELACEMPAAITTSVSIDATGASQPVVTVACSRNEPEQPATGGSRLPAVTLTVLKGQCDGREFVFTEPVISIGRTPEPADAHGQVRSNHVAFAETRDGISETVGRAHARLQFDAESGHYHLFNEGSSNPTSIVRGGRTIRVAPRDPRGVRVQSGDHLQLGRAVLRLTVE